MGGLPMTGSGDCRVAEAIGNRLSLFRVAHASRVLAIASSRSRTFLERLFRRDAETNTRDACATRNLSGDACTSLESAGSQPRPFEKIRRQAADGCRLAACAPQTQRSKANENLRTCFLFRTSQPFHELGRYSLSLLLGKGGRAVGHAQ